MASKAAPREALEIRWHGRGGQGAISSAQILAQAAYDAGYMGVTSAPTFGAERRGAPVSASNRLSPTPIRTFSQIQHPAVVVVLDDTLLAVANATQGLEPGGWLIVNTHLAPEALVSNGDYRVATVDATTIAREVGLDVAGSVIVNTAMLGALARATGLVSLDNIEKAISHKFSATLANTNFEAARRTYEMTRLSEPAGAAKEQD